MKACAIFRLEIKSNEFEHIALCWAIKEMQYIECKSL